jgi:ADP-heptose:LPS heptosyltransferase
MRPWPVVEGVRKLAVLRPNAVGDFVFALPALYALRQTYPQAELVYLGKSWHRDFLQGRPGPVDRAVAMPPVPGVGAPPDAAADALAVAAFVDAMHAEGFDLVLQMYGGGQYANPFVRRFGARVAVGARTPDAAALDRWVAYREPAPRRLALLEVAALAGARLRLPVPPLCVTLADRIEAARAVPPLPGERLVVLQPGATDPRRRWPAECFARLAALLAGQGATVAVHGSGAEADLVDSVAAQVPAPFATQCSILPLAGKLSLGGLCALLERATLVVSNDTGPLHLALALGVPSVGIFWLTNLVEGMPLQPSLLRAALSVQTRCPVCGIDNRAVRCAHDVSFVDDVGLEEVAMLASQALLEGRQAGWP